MSVYHRTIKVLEERGWCQGAYEDDENRVCLSKAIGLANGFRGHTWVEQAALAEVVPDFEGIIEFNDDPHTTYEDVVLALKRAHEATTDA